MILTRKCCYVAGSGAKFSKVGLTPPLLVAFAIFFATFAGCSDSGNADSKGNGNDSSSTDASAMAEIDPPLDEWATSATAEYGKQVEAGGQPDFNAVARAIAPATQALTAALCESFRNDDAFTDSGKASELEKQVAFAADEALARALAHKPRLLVALGMTTWGQWPPFALKDPAPAPDMPVGDLSQGLSQFLKPEFIGEDGGLSIPSKGAPGYQEFQAWFYDPALDNPLLEQTTVTTQSFNGWTDTCSK